MTDHDLPPCPHAAALQLLQLARAYPAFRFRHERVALRGIRWTAERKNGLDPGLHTIITASLAELRDGLAQDQARHAR